VARHDDSNDANYDQPTLFWEKVLDEGHRKRLVNNIVGSLKQATPQIQQRAVEQFSRVSREMGEMLQQGLDEAKKCRHHI